MRCGKLCKKGECERCDAIRAYAAGDETRTLGEIDAARVTAKMKWRSMEDENNRDAVERRIDRRGTFGR